MDSQPTGTLQCSYSRLIHFHIGNCKTNNNVEEKGGGGLMVVIDVQS
ncbi:hypothetical protein [Mesorhizobium sp.]|nr:hypothetical protein [Mesorhizobium sp.]